MANLTKYSLDCETRSSFEMGQLVPFLCQEVVPGDQYRVNSTTLIRTVPLLSPLMHRLDYFQRFYYVPYRLLVDKYEKMVTDPDKAYKVPDLFTYCPENGMSSGEYMKKYPLMDYFGLKTEFLDLPARKVFADLNALPFLAYYMIYNFFYMRSDLNKLYIDDFDPQSFEKAELKSLLGQVLYVNEGYDYFTSAKTETQYGDMVQLDMDGNKTITVPEMRLAERLQTFKERLLRVGGKYVNYIREFFDVAPLDARVQQPKFLGGSNSVLNISDVEQTSPSDGGSVGTLYGKSVSVNQADGVQYDVYEHGLIIGLHFVRPRVSNIGGCPKMFTRKTYFDFFNPHFVNLGFQELENRELDPSRSGTFGYVPRYDELRFGNDIVSGDFRKSLNYWHLSRDIAKESLSDSFVKCFPDNRIFPVVNVPDGDISGSVNLKQAYYVLLTFVPSSADFLVKSDDFIICIVFLNDASLLRDKEVYLPFYNRETNRRVIGKFVVEEIEPFSKDLYYGSSHDFSLEFLEISHYPEEAKSVAEEILSRFKDEHYSVGKLTFGADRNIFMKGYAFDSSVSSGVDLPYIKPIIVGTDIYPTLWLKTWFTLSFGTRVIPVGEDGKEVKDDKPVFQRIYLDHYSYDGLNSVVIKDALPVYRENNHLLAVTYNNVDVLRPLPNLKYNVLE